MSRQPAIPGIGTKKSDLPHHEEAECEIDDWTTDGIRYQLVERAGLFSLRVWDLYRWVALERGSSQIVARRLADVLRGEGAEVVDMERRRA